MNPELVERLKYSYNGYREAHSLPPPLVDSLRIISDFFSNSANNKLCLVFPTKQFAAQWLSIPTVLFLIQSDFTRFKNEIAVALENYKRGDILILNNDAVVEWVRKTNDGFVFKHKEHKGVSEITINVKNISKIQPAPASRKALSGYQRVKDALAKSNENPVDRLLGIQSAGNRLYQKNSICLVSKHISFENSISEIAINNFLVDEYIRQGKIDDAGDVDAKSPLLITNNLTNLALYLTLSDTVSKIIIDGYSAIHDRSGDFNDIDVKKIPTILITDLSEVSNFEDIVRLGFDFYNFTKDNLKLPEISKLSPFSSFDKKLHKYVSFNLQKEICEDNELETITKLIHSLDGDESQKELLNLKILLIQLTNLVSRIAHPVTPQETYVFRETIAGIEDNFSRNRFYLGGSVKAAEECILLLRSVVEKFARKPSEKCTRLRELLRTNQYDYIICATDEETKALSRHLRSSKLESVPKVISVTNLNDNLLDEISSKAILIGWAKANNVNRLLSSFLFPDLTVLFYQFESRYFTSLQNRNKKFVGSVSSTINDRGIRYEATPNGRLLVPGFTDLYRTSSNTEKDTESNFDIADFELKLKEAQFSKYIIKGNLAESVKSRRVEFKNEKFIYLTDTHGLLVLEHFRQSSKRPLYIHKSRIENLHQGDVIAFLKTEREVLGKIVGKFTTTIKLSETIRWIDLWKSLLRNHYELLNKDFGKLVSQLKENGCDRDPVTIRSWLFDDLRIGPRKDDDLIAIAILTNGTDLSENIKEVRAAIKQMTSWRMQASDFVIEQLKTRIKTHQSDIQVNSIIDFADLGEVEILEITEISNSADYVDIKNVNRLLEKSKL